jgi:alkaline phosphatase
MMGVDDKVNTLIIMIPDTSTINSTNHSNPYYHCSYQVISKASERIKKEIKKEQDKEKKMWSKAFADKEKK